MKKLYFVFFVMSCDILCAEGEVDKSEARVLEVGIVQKIALSYHKFDPRTKMMLANTITALVEEEILTFKQLRSKGAEVELGELQSLDTFKNIIAKNKTVPPIIDGWIHTPYPWMPADLVSKLSYYTPGMKEEKIEDPKIRKEYSQAINNDLLIKLSLTEEKLIQVLESYSALAKTITE